MRCYKRHPAIACRFVIPLRRFLATAAQAKTERWSTREEKEPRQPISAYSGLAVSGLLWLVAWAAEAHR